MSSRFPFLDRPPLAFAHRGGAGAWPENTLPAFAGAVDLGYTHLETDVHLTSDGVLVAFHDDELDRVTDRTGRIAELPWSTVGAALVDGREVIPRFDELLDAFPEAFFNVDPKEDETVEPLAEAIRRAGAVERVCIGSFSGRRLAQLRQLLGPLLCTSLGPAGIAQLRAASYGLPVRRFPAPCVQVPPSSRGLTIVDERFVETAHRHGMQVHVWTIDDEDEMRRLLDLGVDGIMTDLPGVLKDVLIVRGAWHGPS
jgi:glycerophosphoryl diester phosphodiesterase